MKWSIKGKLSDREAEEIAKEDDLGPCGGTPVLSGAAGLRQIL